MLPGKPQWVAHGAGKNYKVIFYRVCSEAEVRYRMETRAQFLRKRLGDPGRH